MERARLNLENGYRVRIAACFMALLAVLLPLAWPASASAATLDRIRQAGKIALGYRTDARPFSYRDESGNPDGYAVVLCKQVVDSLKTELGISELAVEWVPVTIDDEFKAVKENKVDLLCGAGETLSSSKGCRFLNSGFPGRNRSTSPCDCSDRAKGGLIRSSTLRTSVAWLPCTNSRETDFFGSRGHANREVAGKPN